MCIIFFVFLGNAALSVSMSGHITKTGGQLNWTRLAALNDQLNSNDHSVEDTSQTKTLSLQIDDACDVARNSGIPDEATIQWFGPPEPK